MTEEIIFLKEDWIVQGLRIEKGTAVLIKDGEILEICNHKE